MIKTPGMRWTPEHGLQQQRWAHFSVDRRHHLVSALSRLSPSPDWCVGVASLDLCLDNCTWLADTAVRLFAWDAGGESRPIRRVADRAEIDGRPGPPFGGGGGGTAEPVALLRLRRFDRPPGDAAAVAACAREDETATKVAAAAASELRGDRAQRDPCAMGSWSDWTECSADCGAAGSRTRSRAAVATTGSSCADPLQTSSAPCRDADCPPPTPPECELFSWSEWSACTDGFALCSPRDARSRPCSRHRRRSYRRKGAEAACNRTRTQEERCRPSDAGIVAAFIRTDALSKCFAPADSGPCEGNFLRWHYDDVSAGCRTFLYGGCRGNANRYGTEAECMHACREYHQRPTRQASGGEASFSTLPTSTIAPGEATEAAHSEYNGPLSSNRSVVDGTAVDCVMSPWSPWTECSATCGRHGVRARRRTVVRPASDGGKKCRRRKLRRRRCSLPSCGGSDAVDRCQYAGGWSSWSACGRSCGADAVQERVRRAKATASHGSRCPVKLQRRLCSLPACS